MTQNNGTKLVYSVVKRRVGDIQKRPESVAKEPQIIKISIDANEQVLYQPQLIVYKLCDVYDNERFEMKNVGLDIGTKTIVLAFNDKNDDSIKFISEINGYWPFERSTPFVKNMLSDPNKVRSDGTSRPARFIELNGKLIVIGSDAEELAYSNNDSLLRPMAEGGINQDEEALTVLASIIHGLIDKCEYEIGTFGKELKICYCTTAEAINKDINIAYHERVVNMIISSYNNKTKTKINSGNIKESHAIVLDMDSENQTGIGISWGAGTVTVSYVKYGLEIYSFCYVGAGDWIDEQVAMRFGYNPNASKMKKASPETPTTVSRRKMNIDLNPNKLPDDRVGKDIVIHYDVLIERVIDGIINGFVENENNARIEHPINIYMAGGTSSPNGFVERVTKKFSESTLPFQIGSISRSDKPLYAVASGCLKAVGYGIIQ